MSSRGQVRLHYSCFLNLLVMYFLNINVIAQSMLNHWTKDFILIFWWFVLGIEKLLCFVQQSAGPMIVLTYSCKCGCCECSSWRSPCSHRNWVHRNVYLWLCLHIWSIESSRHRPLTGMRRMLTLLNLWDSKIFSDNIPGRKGLTSHPL